MLSFLLSPTSCNTSADTDATLAQLISTRKAQTILLNTNGPPLYNISGHYNSCRNEQAQTKSMHISLLQAAKQLSKLATK